MGWIPPAVESLQAAFTTGVSATAAGAAGAGTAAATTEAAATGAATGAAKDAAKTASILGAINTVAKVATAGALIKGILTKPKAPGMLPPATPPPPPSSGDRAPAAELGGTALVGAGLAPNTSGGKTLLGM